ncbi:MAG: ATP-binding cassette domain-containing protein [Coxiellaceae bacterium]|jgi:ABC-type uncharacterized transport system ATPase component|nr:ATP-binding cassette domain-containing protein [Coxiellaceae bacterium]
MKEALLNLNNINLELPGLLRPILKNISYAIYPKDFVTLLGHNGSGKSSLLKILDRRYHPTHGDIFLQDRALRAYTQREITQQIITLTQNYQESLFPSLTVLENCILVKQLHENHAFRIGMTDEKKFFISYLGDFSQRLIEKLNTPVVKLSGDEQQKKLSSLI